MDIVIIEGAGKVSKITNILKELNKNSKVIATCGHIERLQDSQYDQTGIDKELHYYFEWIEGKSKILKDINTLGMNANKIYIATDPDREGEGIAWHIYNKLNSDNKNKAVRITFNEISSKAIAKAINEPRKIDIDYVNAYLARIALDKKIGYGLSKYLQQNINLKSAGRVQSVVLRLIADRINEIENFVPKTYYQISPIINNIELKHFKSDNDLNLFDYKDKPFCFNNLESATDYLNSYLTNEFELIEIGEGKINYSYPSKPYKTSTIQSELIKKLKIKSKDAEAILQELYQKGYITYPRTDATRLSDDFCKEAYNFVLKTYPKLANNEFRFNKSGGGAQDAHEGIRVLHLDEFGNELNGNARIAYKIIYDHTIIQFMNPMITETTDYVFRNNLDYFKTNSEFVKELGFNEYLAKNKEDKIIEFNLNSKYNADNWDSIITSTTTKPPEYYNQASLIKKLEELGIGRPSTYASSVEVNHLRGYTQKDAKENILITNDGINANNSLLQNWNELINYEFTAKMETALDQIADKKLNYKTYLFEFLNEYENKLYSMISLNVAKPNQELKIVGKCPKCNSDLVEKQTSTGKTMFECSKRKYNWKTKKVSGCDYVEWKDT